MKKVVGISLFVFCVVVAGIFVFGLVFNKEENKLMDSNDSQTGELNQKANDQLINSNKNLVLNMQEIAKHNKSTNCWMLIKGKVYNVTSYFGSHPGGNGTMTATCGKDATAAYSTKNPTASSISGGAPHSSKAISLLSQYYIGDLNQTIGQEKITQTAAIVTPPSKGDDEYEIVYEDD